MPRRGIELSDEVWRAAKAKAATEGMTLQDWVASTLEVATTEGHVRREAPVRSSVAVKKALAERAIDNLPGRPPPGPVPKKRNRS